MRMFRMCIIGIGVEGGLRDRVLVALGNVLHITQKRWAAVLKSPHL